MKSNIFLFVLIFIFSSSLAQNGLIGNGFAHNDWSTTWCFDAGAGLSRILTTTANGTGNQYFRLETCWDGNTNQWGPSSTTNDYQVSIGIPVSSSDVVQNSTSKAYFINVASTSHKYVFKTRGAGNPPGNPSIVAFCIQGDVRTVSTVSRDISDVSSGQSPLITATLNSQLQSGQGVYLRYSSDNWTTSTVIEMTGSGASYTANIPTMAPGATVRYYVFTSGSALTISGADADFFTININNNGGSNYQYSVATQYRSFQSGNWNQTATWQYHDGTSWQNATVTPVSSNAGAITVRNGHTVSLSASVTADQIAVETGAQLKINSSVVLTLENGAGDELTIYGTVENTGGSVSRVTTSYTPTIIVKNGGLYIHNRNFTNGLLNAENATSVTWEDGSVCRIAMDPAGFNTSLNQNFYDLEFNWPSGTAARAMEGNRPSNVRGTFKVIATGTSGSLVLGNSSSSTSMTVNNMEISDGNFYVAGASASNNVSLTVNGNFIQSGGFFEIKRNVNTATQSARIKGDATISGGTTRVFNNSGTGVEVAELYVEGNLTIAGGILDLHANAGSTQNSGRLFLKGNLTVSSGELAYTRASTSTSSGVYFEGTGHQRFSWTGGTLSTASGGVGRRFFYKTSSGPSGLSELYGHTTAQITINGTEGPVSPLTGFSRWPTTGALIKNLTVNNAAGVTLSRNKTVNDSLLLSNGQLNYGAFSLSLADNAHIIRSGGSLSAAPTFGSSVNVTYAEHTASITTGVELPASSSVLNNLTINSGNGVTLNNARTANGIFTLTNGVLTTTSSNLLTVANTATNAIVRTSGFVSGPLNRALPASTSSGDFFFPMGKTNYYPFFITDISTGTGTSSVTVEAFNNNCGGNPGTGLAALSTSEYWQATPSGNYLNCKVRISRGSALGTLDAIGRSASAGGSYENLNGTVNGNSIENSDYTGVTLGFFVMAQKGATCTAPTLNVQYNGEESKTICQGESYALTANPSGGSGCTGSWEYAWFTGDGTGSTYWNGSTWDNAETWGAYSTINNVAPASSKIYKVKVRCSEDYNCNASDIAGVQLLVNSVPVQATPNNGSRCDQGTVNISVSNVPGGCTIDWYTDASGGTAILTGNPFFTTPVISSTTLYYAESRNTSTGCVSSVRAAVTATVTTTPSAPSAGNNGPLCEGNTLSLSASGISGATYSWTGPNSYTSSDQNPTVSTNTTSSMSGTYYATATIDGCTSPAGSTTVTVLSGAGTPGSITGLTTQCPNLTGQTYSIDAVQGATGYAWTVPTGWSITNGQNTTAITVTTGNEGQGGTIRVSALNSCGAGTPSSLAVTMATLSVSPSTVHITNNNTCTGVLKTMSITDGALGTGGVWQWHSGSCSGTVVALGTSHSINPPSGTSVTYYIKAVGLCNTTACVSGTVNVLPDAPPQPGVISGISEQEAGLTGQIYSINPVSGATSYLWSVPHGWQITAGQGTTSITVTTGQEGDDGLITVSSGNACGYSIFSLLDVTVTQLNRTLTLSGVLLEGLYDANGIMRQAQDDNGAHWPSGTADVITVELHDALNYQTITYTASNVSLSVNGTATVVIPASYSGSYYLTINHRNSIEVTTALPVAFNNTVIDYSFALPVNVYGGNLGSSTDSYFFIYGGDANKDGIIDSGDMGVVENENVNFTIGYVPEDINGDGLVDSSDMAVIENNTNLFISTILP